MIEIEEITDIIRYIKNGVMKDADEAKTLAQEQYFMGQYDLAVLLYKLLRVGREND